MNPSNETQEILEASFKFGHGVIEKEGYKDCLKSFPFGYPIATSLAPTLHGAISRALSLPWTFKLLETKDTAEFLPALKADNIIGCAVTMPHKVTLMSMVDDLTEESRIVGAINTVFIREDTQNPSRKRYVGTNTDTIGVREAFLQNHPNILHHSQGKPALVIGGGGACRAAVYALLNWLGASKVYLVNRLELEVTPIIESFEKHGFGGRLVYVDSIDKAKSLESAFLIVGTVPNYPPKEPVEVLVRDIVQQFLNRAEKGYMLEMCYFPTRRTAYYEMGEKSGWTMIFGTEAMIWQGAAQQSLWMEKPLNKIPVEETKNIIANKIANTK